MPHFPQLPDASGSELDALGYRGTSWFDTDGPDTPQVSQNTNPCLAIFLQPEHEVW